MAPWWRDPRPGRGVDRRGQLGGPGPAWQGAPRTCSASGQLSADARGQLWAAGSQRPGCGQAGTVAAGSSATSSGLQGLRISQQAGWAQGVWLVPRPEAAGERPGLQGPRCPPPLAPWGPAAGLGGGPGSAGKWGAKKLATPISPTAEESAPLLDSPRGRETHSLLGLASTRKGELPLSPQLSLKHPWLRRGAGHPEQGTAS